MYSIKTLAQNIRKARKLTFYNQRDMSRMLMISQNAYSKIELGLTNLSLKRFFDIADVLSVDPITLLANMLNERKST